ATAVSLAGCGNSSTNTNASASAASTASTASGAASASTTAAAAPLSPAALSNVYPFGANTFLGSEVDITKRERTVQMMKAAHIGWMKEQFLWDQIEHVRGTFTWDKYDEIVGLAEKYGIKVIARLDYPPPWTQKKPNFNAPPDNMPDYADFVNTFVKHYKGRVAAVQIWNEPNLAVEWGGSPPDAVAYTKLLKLAYGRAKEADPNVTVLSAPLAETLERSPRALVETEFLQMMYDAGAKGSFDVLSANAYGLAYPPDDAPRVDRLNFQRFTFLHDVVVKNGEPDKPVWFNEYGWNASPADFPPDQLIWGRVTRAQQAQYTVDGIKLAKSKYPYVGVVNIWYFRQVGSIPKTDSSYYFDMVDPEFNEEPVYGAIRDAAAQWK
ncbi:MAG TPA: endo-1,4-beta-xylanase, partial [Chloroflexota bacterium]|nr:endo-1,4-beta-xylanase [Chloroflexota bacterium]